MAGRTKEVELREIGAGWFFKPTSRLIARIAVPDYAPREEDRAWVDRELGDAGNEPIPFEITEAGKAALK